MPDLRVVPDPVPTLFTADAGKVIGCWLAMATFCAAFWVTVGAAVWRLFK